VPPSTTANRRVGAVFDHPPLAGKLKGERREKRAFCSQEGEERERKEKMRKKWVSTLIYSSPDPTRFKPNPVQNQDPHARPILLLPFIFCTPHNTAAPPFFCIHSFLFLFFVFFIVFIFFHAFLFFLSHFILQHLILV